MPQLPRYESQGQVSANGRVIAIPVRKADTAIGDALKDVGQATFEFGSRLQQSKLDGELTGADQRARAKIDQVRTQLEQDASIPDEQIGKYLGEATDRIVAEEGQTISAANARKAWGQRAEGWKLDGDAWAAKVGRGRQIDRTRADLTTSSVRLGEQAGDLTVSPETFAKNADMERQRIAREVSRGIIDQETAAGLYLKIDAAGRKDAISRVSANVEGLVKAGDSKAADQAISDFEGSFAEKKALKAVKEGIETDVRQAKALAEAERAKAQKLTANRIEVDILDGKANRATINAAVERGEISVNDQPALIRAYQAQQEKLVADAKMSPEERARQADWSADVRLVLNGLPPEQFIAGPDAWGADLKGAFSRMTPDDQRAIRAEVLKRREAGGTVDARTSAFNELMATAKFVAPKEWNIAGTKPTKEGLRYRGLLQQYAATAAEKTGGMPLKGEEARQLAYRALTAADSKERIALDMQMTDQGIDVDLMQETEAMLTAKLGRAPTARELMNAYKQVAP
jgi:hypothetical protein